MEFNSLMDPKSYISWEQDPSTRESIRLLTKAYPVDSTLSVSGTAKDLISVAPGFPTVNMITNPSMETGNPPTGYSAVRSAVLAQDAVVYKYGLKSMKITPPNAARGEGAYWNLGSWPRDEPLSISAYFSDNAASGKDARVELVAHTTPISGVTDVRFVIGSTATFTGAGWYRSTAEMEPRRGITIMYFTDLAVATFVEDELVLGSGGASATIRTVGSNWIAIDSIDGTFLTDSSAAPRVVETLLGDTSGATATVSRIQRSGVNMETVYMHFVTATKHATVFYVDGAQAEANFSTTDFCDGSQGYYCWWDGTAHASTSRRWRKMSSIRSYRLHTTRDIYFMEDQIANRLGVNAEDRGEFIPAGTDFGEDHPIFLDHRISFVNVNAGELPRVYGVIRGV